MLMDPSGFIYGNSICVRDNRLRITITSPNCCLLKASKNVFGVGEQAAQSKESTNWYRLC